MGKKNYDINLFKAASKEDKKIQTGVSKSFLFVIAGFVLVIVVGAYIGMLFMEVSSLKSELQRYEGYKIYSTNVNQITDKINQDMAFYNQIQSDINAGIAIKDYARQTSKLYPGLTELQKAMIISNRYTYNGIEYQGCVPDSIIIDSENNIGIEYSYTDGLSSYEIMKHNESTGNLESTDVVFEKGYILFRFQSPDDTASLAYVNNIISMAPNVFAIEDGVSNRDVISSLSFEHGIMSEPNEDNPNFVLYVKAKLKSALQIILEDEWLSAHLVPISGGMGISNITYSGSSISLEIYSSVPIYTVCSYFESTKLFESIDFRSVVINTTGQTVYHHGTILLFVKEGK